MASANGSSIVRDATIAILLGLFLAALVVGAVRASYPPPQASAGQLRELRQQEQALAAARKAVGQMSKSHEAMYKKLVDQVATQTKAAMGSKITWVRNISALFVMLGIALVGASLALAKPVPLVSWAALLAGMLTALHGSGFAFTAISSATYAIAAVGICAIAGSCYAAVRRVKPSGGDGAGVIAGA